jgi:hypothetical protein
MQLTLLVIFWKTLLYTFHREPVILRGGIQTEDRNAPRKLVIKLRSKTLVSETFLI